MRGSGARPALQPLSGIPGVGHRLRRWRGVAGGGNGSPNLSRAKKYGPSGPIVRTPAGRRSSSPGHRSGDCRARHRARSRDDAEAVVNKLQPGFGDRKALTCSRRGVDLAAGRRSPRSCPRTRGGRSGLPIPLLQRAQFRGAVVDVEEPDSSELSTRDDDQRDEERHGVDTATAKRGTHGLL